MAAKKKYRVLKAITWAPDRSAEADDIVDDIPEASVPWLLEQGVIELATARAKD